MSITIQFELEKEVKHSVRFKEVVEEGKAPVIGSLYIKKWYVGDAKDMTITINKPDGPDTSS